MTKNETDTLIIGAGPIGIELAVALKKRGLDYLHIDAGQVAETIAWYPEAARFFSSASRIAIAGVPLRTLDQSKATKEEYILYLQSVVEQFDLNVQTYTRALSIRRSQGQFAVAVSDTITDQPATIEARNVVCVLGDMHQARMLGVPGEDLPFVSHYFHSPRPYFRRKLLIVGGRNSAVEAALRCHHAGVQVTISYRGNQFPEESIKYWLLPEIRSLCASGAIEFLPQTEPLSIEPGRVRLGAVSSGEPTQIETDFVLLMTGYTMNTQLLEDAGVQLLGNSRAPEFDPGTMQTNIPGLYVAGTATAGSQERHKVFIETSHVHVERIVAALTGEAIPEARPNRPDLET